MKDTLLSWLESIGLEEQRARLYVIALSKGEATATELAKAMKIGRTAVYDNLRVLEERGYVKTIFHGKRKLFLPLHPKELYKKFESQKEQLKMLLPDFLSVYAQKGSLPFSRVFQGPYAAREVHEDLLSVTKKEYVYFSPQLLALQTFSFDRTYIEKWIKRRVAKGIHSRSLRIKSKTVPNAKIFNDESTYLRQIRYLPEYVDLRSSIYIYEDNVGIISTKKEGYASIIHSADIAFSLKQIFEFLWSISVRS